MLQVHALRRVFDAALKEKDSFLIFEVLERLDFLGLQDEYNDWGKESLPVLLEIKREFEDEILTSTLLYGQ